jgi:hypothetical protein
MSGTTAHRQVSADSINTAKWRKSSHSGAVGNCVELAPLANADMAVRNSRNPRGPALVYSGVDMSAFLAGVRAGDFGATSG